MTIKAETYCWISCGWVFSLYLAVSETGQSIISAGAAAVSQLKHKSAQAQRPWSPVYLLPDEFHRRQGISARAISFWRVYSCFQYFSWAVVLLLCFPTCDHRFDQHSTPPASQLQHLLTTPTHQWTPVLHPSASATVYKPRLTPSWVTQTCSHQSLFVLSNKSPLKLPKIWRPLLGPQMYHHASP